MKSNIKFTDFGLMYSALKKSCRGVRWKTSVTQFEINGLKNTAKSIKEIQNGTYKLSDYFEFMIYEPKERKITATRIKDRQVQRSLCDNYVYNAIVKSFIYDNCACQKGKGTDFTYKRMKTHLHKMYRKYGNDFYYLKCDIHHFFESINHDILKEFVTAKVHSDTGLQMIFQVIDSFGEKGLGLGSQLSQILALLYLNELDHIIKEKLKIKHYIRYMDDFVLFSNDKDELIQCLHEIEIYLECIGLSLNGKTTIQPINKKLKFMNWKFSVTGSGKVLMIQDRKQISLKRKKIHKLFDMASNGIIPIGRMKQSINGIIAHLSKGNSYRVICEFRRYLNMCLLKYTS